MGKITGTSHKQPPVY